MSLDDNISIVDYTPEHARELVRMWRDSFERAVGVIDPHPIEAQINFLNEKLVAENRVRVVVEKATGAIIGFMASTPEMITQLYVHVDHQHKGIGRMLVEIAKRDSSGRLRLYTFKANQNAQSFYERQGFRIIGTGFEKEWQLEDIEYEWVNSET
jgi:ribosomal protein S18 acetylase RimI-like enzyme